MSNKREALEAALNALESERIMAADDQGNYTVEVTPKRIIDAIEKVKAALAEPEQEPVFYAVFAWGRLENTYHTRDSANLIRDAYRENACASVAPLYTSPREWQELSEDEALEAFNRSGTIVDTSPIEQYVICQFISTALRAKNGG